ncbi:MAG: 3-deoxy-manno-octulosonate cytidylyltransferase [Rikenellaceae bacterium]|nr:3-deoxy-manno-octulosonate cytidylyltransferase [Rikenellaceae bacterium]
MIKYLALIPARYASTRFPAKPLADILGKPMIQHVYERAARLFEHYYVATDDTRIADAVTAFGGNVVMTSTEHRSGTDRCREALEKVSAETGIEFDVVVNIQGDEPYIQTEQLELIKSCFADRDTQIATLVKPFSADEDIFNPNLPKVVLNARSEAMYFSRSPIPYLRNLPQEEWQSAHTYLKHIGLYAYKSNILKEITSLEAGELEKLESLEQLRWIENGYKIKVAKTEFESYAIDTPEDLERLLEVLKRNTI